MAIDDYEAKVRGRLIKFPSVDGLSELEMGTIVGQISDEMQKIEEERGIVDTSKIAIIAAYSFAARLYNLQQRSDTDREADTKKLDEMSACLEKAIGGEEKKK